MSKRIPFLVFVLFGIGVGIGLRVAFSRPVAAAIETQTLHQSPSINEPSPQSVQLERSTSVMPETDIANALDNLKQMLVTPITNTQQIKQILIEIGERNRLWYAAQTGWLHRTGESTTKPILLVDDLRVSASNDEKQTSESWYRVEGNCQYEGYFIQTSANGEILQTVVTTPEGLSVNLTLFNLGYITDSLTLPDEQENYPVEFTGYDSQVALSDINQLENAVPDSLQVSAFLASDNPSHLYVTLTWKFSEPDIETGKWLGLDEAMIGSSEIFAFDLQTGSQVFFENRYETASGAWVIASSGSSSVEVVAELPQEAQAMFSQLVLQANDAASIE